MNDDLIGTPTATMRPRSKKFAEGRTPNPAEYAEMWPTPKAQNGKGVAIHGEGGPDLQTMVELFPTPTSKNGLTGGSNIRKAHPELWPTPDVRGFTNKGSLKMLAEAAEDREEFSGMAYRTGRKKKEALWPTPTTFDWNTAVKDRTEQGSKTYKSNLKEAALIWPTPMSSEADKNSKNRDKYLPGAVQKYPTPTNSMMTLQDMEQARFSGSDTRRPKYSTPTVNGAKNSPTESQTDRGTLTANLVESGIKGQLSPDWVERLMGYPDGWTDIERDDVDMENSYPAAWLDGSWDMIPRVAVGVKNRVNRLKCLGNAVVPQIPMLLWGLVARVLWV